MDWYRRYTDRDGNRKIYKAGFFGAALYDALCDINAKEDLGGEITQQFQDLDWIARRMMLDEEFLAGTIGDPDDSATPASFLRVYLERIADPSCGLLRIERVGDGEEVWVIVGWVDRQPKMPDKSTERVKKHRQSVNSKRNETERNAFHDVSSVSVKRDETHETHIEKEREKEKESDSSPQETADPHRVQPEQADLIHLHAPNGKERTKSERKERKKSEQETIYGLMQSARAEVLGPEALPDQVWSIKRINKELQPLLRVNRQLLGAAYHLFLADDRKRSLDPPCATWAFIRDWSGYVSRAQKEQAVHA